MEQVERLTALSGDWLRRYLCVASFLLPFMFGCQLMATEDANLPTDVLVWVLLGFTPAGPAFLAPLVSGVGLLWAVLTYGDALGGRGRAGLWWVLVWYGVVLSGLVGLAVTTELDYALNWLLHFLGAGTFGLSVWWASRHDGRLLPALSLSVACGTVTLCLYAGYQRLGGLERQLAELERQHLAQFGEGLPGQMAQKLQQLRVNSFFSDPNLFAAHLLVTFPAVALTAWRLGGRWLTLALSCLVAVVFWWTGSRGGLIGLLAGLSAGVWCLDWLQARRWRWCLPLLAGLLAVGVWQYASRVQAGGGVSSASVRLGYYEVAARMLCEAPLTGRGLGEFYPWYVRLKPFGAELSRDAHSFLASCASQCGVLGVAAALLALAFPWVQVVRRTRWSLGADEAAPRLTAAAVLSCLPVAGYAAWSVHALFQFNELVPGTVYLLTALPLLAQPPQPSRPSGAAWRGWTVWRALALVPGVACLVWVGGKLPGEAALQASAEEQSSQQLALGEARRLRALGQDTRGLEQSVAVRRQALTAQLARQCAAVPLAPAPCRMLLRLLRAEVQGAFASGRSPEPGTLALLRRTAEQLVSRTPHRASSWQELAWAAAAAGEWAELERCLGESWVWFPGDGAADVLLGVLARREPSLLAPLSEVTAKVVPGEDGERLVRLQVVAPGVRALVSELFCGSVALPLSAPGRTRYELAVVP